MRPPVTTPLMNPNDRKARILLKKYLKGECTPDEVELLHRWYDQMRVPLPRDRPDLEERLKRAVWTRIGGTEAPVRRLPVRLIAAACIVGVLLIGGGLLLRFRKVSVSNHTQVASLLTLPDGSRVWLNADSRLSWGKGFARDRRVELEGEGYFKVAPDAAHPFRVETKGLVTTVLGTEFNEESYEGEDRVRVALVSGSVEIAYPGHSVPPQVLRPGQIASLVEGEHAFAVAQGDPGAYAAWVSGGFVLQGVPLEVALKRLCRKYGYTLKVDFTKGQQKPITASFNRASFEEILSGILYINHLTYSIRDSVVTVR